MVGTGVVPMRIWRLLLTIGLLLAVAGAIGVWSAIRSRPQLPLRIPVLGLAPAQVHSSWGAPRGGGRRRHHGVDLFAPRGRTVCSATAGVVVFRGTNELGGRIVYVVGEGLLTYYAHLGGWAPGLHFGQRVHRGTPLGRVGDSGNAQGSPCHLHFATHPLWRWGRPVDPAPFLTGRAGVVEARRN
jgi:peptidoglycan LD-endopeptidase LytH